MLCHWISSDNLLWLLRFAAQILTAGGGVGGEGAWVTFLTQGHTLSLGMASVQWLVDEG